MEMRGLPSVRLSHLDLLTARDSLLTNSSLALDRGVRDISGPLCCRCSRRCQSTDFGSELVEVTVILTTTGRGRPATKFTVVEIYHLFYDVSCDSFAFYAEVLVVI